MPVYASHSAFCCGVNVPDETGKMSRSDKRGATLPKVVTVVSLPYSAINADAFELDLASRFYGKTRRANALIYKYKTVAEQCISLKTRRKIEFKHNHLWLTIASQLQSPYEYLR